MDKTGIIVVSLCAALLGWWFVEQVKVAKQQEQYAAAQRAAELKNELANSNSIAATTPTMTATTTVMATATTAAQVSTAATMVFDTNLAEQTIVLTNAKAIYTFTSRGGGLKQVELPEYPEAISARWKGRIHNSSSFAALNAHASVPVLGVLGDPSLVGDGNFTLTRTGDGVRAEKIFANGLVLTKEFHPTSNYLMNASVSWKNTSATPVTLPAQELVIGTAAPMDADDMSRLWGAMWFDGTNYNDITTLYFNTNAGTIFGLHRTPTPDYSGGTGNVMWAAVHNQYFALLAMPKEPAQQMLALPVTLPRFQDDDTDASVIAPQGVQAALLYPGTTLPTGSTLAHSMVLYAGPKEYRTLSRIGDEFQNHADLVMNFGKGFSSFWGVGTFFAKVLLAAMNALHDATHIGYGWVIVLITILIRALFWPLTAISLKSSKKMQALAPEIAALKEKYKDDMQKFTQKQMEVWKKNGVSPMSGCLPMLVQMPVFMGFFTMIRSAIELRGASFLWASDLSKPDTLFMIPGITFLPFNLSTPEGLPFNLLPLLMVGAMVWQAHLQPASPGMDPGQQKMMRYMPLMFLLFFYNYSSGMALYMMVSTFAGIIQAKVTKITMAQPATPALTPGSKSKK